MLKTVGRFSIAGLSGVNTAFFSRNSRCRRLIFPRSFYSSISEKKGVYSSENLNYKPLFSVIGTVFGSCLAIQSTDCSSDYPIKVIGIEEETVRLSSEPEERAFVSKLKERVYKEHSFVNCSRTSTSEALFRDSFSLIFLGPNFMLLSPKIVSQDKLSNTIRIQYDNGVTEETDVDDLTKERIGMRKYPDGRILQGKFYLSKFIYGKEVLPNGTKILHCYERLRGFRKKLDGKDLIIAKDGKLGSWSVIEEKTGILQEHLNLEDLILGADEDLSNLEIKSLQQDPAFSEIVKKLLLPEHRKRLHSLCVYSLISLLRYAEEKRLVSEGLDLHTPKETGQTLMERLLERRWGDKKDVELIVGIDPEILKTTGEEGLSWFFKTALEGHESEARFLYEEMKKQKVLFTEQDILCDLIVNNGPVDVEKVFSSSSFELKHQLYRLANIYRRYDLVERMRVLGMKQENVIPDEGGYIGPGMDIIEISGRVRDLFAKMRARGDLLTKEEYEKRYPPFESVENPRSYFFGSDGNGFFHKGHCISRLFGALYFNKKTKGAQYTKAVRKIVVVDGNKVDMYVSSGGTLLSPISGWKKDLSIKAEYVPYDSAVDALDAERSLDLVLAIEKAGYSDLHPGDNIRITRRGAYVIDNELRNLTGLGPIEYHKLINRFPLHPEAVEYVKRKLEQSNDRREDLSDHEAEKLYEQKKKQRTDLLRLTGIDVSSCLRDPKRPISIDLSSILTHRPGFRTQPLEVIVTVPNGCTLEVIGDGPGMSRKKGIEGKRNEKGWIVDMPEGNYSYKLAIRDSRGSLNPESGSYRRYLFCKEQEPLTFNVKNENDFLSSLRQFILDFYKKTG